MASTTYSPTGRVRTKVYIHRSPGRNSEVYCLDRKQRCFPPPLDSLLRPPPISYLETIVEILCAYFPDRWLTIEELAGVINSSPRTIQRRLLAEGTNFRDLMIQTKMSLAKKALLETDSSITQIAMDFGFSASSSFTRSFVGHYGISPTEFRRHPRTTKKP